MTSETRKRVSRSVSGDFDSDGEFADEGGANEDPGSNQAAGKPGRKKNPNSQAARRDQNRIAQREFRLRKQQRIRDLEARVEILSGNKDETYVQMRDIITELMTENQTLRNMVRGLSGFIGEGAGGCLPRMGWTLKEFEAFINKAETDTAFEAFAKRKRTAQEGSALPSASGAAEKRSAPEDMNSSRKRAKTATTNGSFQGPGEVNFTPGVGNSFGASYNSDSPAMGLYSSMRPPSGFPSFLGGLGSDQPGSNSFISGTQPAAGLGYTSTPTTTNGRDTFPAPYSSGTSSESQPANGPSPLQNMSFLHTASSSTASPTQSSPAANPGDDGDLDSDPKAQEARKLVGYHLENYKRNSAYCLPPSLRPTLVQRTVEHEGIIDGIPHPELRNRLILLRGRFNLADCIHSYLTSTTIHGDDVLAHANWEIHENWLKQYGFLIDPVTLSLTNRWRKERGDPEITMTEIAPSEQLPGLAQG